MANQTNISIAVFQNNYRILYFESANTFLSNLQQYLYAVPGLVMLQVRTITIPESSDFFNNPHSYKIENQNLVLVDTPTEDALEISTTLSEKLKQVRQIAGRLRYQLNKHLENDLLRTVNDRVEEIVNLSINNQQLSEAQEKIISLLMDSYSVNNSIELMQKIEIEKKLNKAKVDSAILQYLTDIYENNLA